MEWTKHTFVFHSLMMWWSQLKSAIHAEGANGVPNYYMYVKHAY